jgi:hypothetical protein
MIAGTITSSKVQIQNAKEVIWEIVSVDRHNPAFQGPQPTTVELIAEGATSVWPASGRLARTRK